MLSICIPIYNVDVRSLVEELAKQSAVLDYVVEIIAIDDCSTAFKKENKSIARFSKYIELNENIGRARIRNEFLKYATHHHLLFLDCDVVIDNSNFLANYIKVLVDHPVVICGGHRYSKDRPNLSELLRWKYGTYKESKSTQERQKEPNKSFMTNNFVVRKDILTQLKFDERLSNYGHEDTLFGIQLKKNKHSILHIENSVLIGDREKNEVFIDKTTLSVRNLVTILEFPEYTEDLRNDVALLRFHQRIKFLRYPLYLLFKATKKIQLFYLKKGIVYLAFFDFYKLGILMECLQENDKIRRTK
ncbi:MAG: glycosyltransferase [Bacteroidota bacterium]